MPEHYIPLWVGELDGAGDHQGKTMCEHCRKYFPNDLIRFGTRSPIRPCQHFCTTCAKKLGIINYEDLDASSQNFFGG